MKLLFTFIFGFAVACGAMAQSANDKLEIPPGVHYNRASDEVNAAGKTLLEKAVVGDKTAWKQLFSDEPQTCGPMLWQELKPGADAKLLNAKALTIVVPTPVAVTVEGRALLTNEVRHIFWSALMTRYPALKVAK